MPGPLDGLRVFDLTRILAGPTCTQLLGDLGADVIKIERPGAGDDTRKWGPPYVQGQDGADTRESAYYLCANRNKRSVAIDIARPRGQALARRLLADCDVLVENFKVGDLARYGLGYERARRRVPAAGLLLDHRLRPDRPLRAARRLRLPGPGAGRHHEHHRRAADGEPMKVGVGIADVMCGMYATVGDPGGPAPSRPDRRGPAASTSPCSTARSPGWSTRPPTIWSRRGAAPASATSTPTSCPTRRSPAADGYVILAVGNDGQFASGAGSPVPPELAGRSTLRHQQPARGNGASSTS